MLLLKSQKYKGLLTDHYEQLHANQFDNLKKDASLEI